MSLTLSDNRNFIVQSTGLEISDPVDFNEWAALGPLLQRAVRGVAFAIGDWLVYGADHFQHNSATAGGVAKTRVRIKDYEEALRLTGLDRSTLHTYAHVSRRVARHLRSEQLSWEHHKIVAKLPPDEQRRWLQIAVANQEKGRPVSTRRLRKSILAGQLLSAAEGALPHSDRGVENHIPFVNRLVSWWSKMRERHWLEEATDEQRAAIKRDLKPLISIYDEL